MKNVTFRKAIFFPIFFNIICPSSYAAVSGFERDPVRVMPLPAIENIGMANEEGVWQLHFGMTPVKEGAFEFVLCTQDQGLEGDDLADDYGAPKDGRVMGCFNPFAQKGAAAHLSAQDIKGLEGLEWQGQTLKAAGLAMGVALSPVGFLAGVVSMPFVFVFGTTLSPAPFTLYTPAGGLLLSLSAPFFEAYHMVESCQQPGQKVVNEAQALQQVCRLSRGPDGADMEKWTNANGSLLELLSLLKTHFHWDWAPHPTLHTLMSQGLLVP